MEGVAVYCYAHLYFVFNSAGILEIVAVHYWKTIDSEFAMLSCWHGPPFFFCLL